MGLLMIVFIQNRNISIYNLQETDPDPPKIEQCPEQSNKDESNNNENNILDVNKLKLLLSSFDKSGKCTLKGCLCKTKSGNKLIIQ